MSEEIEKLIKIQGKINKFRFHLCIETNLENKYNWYLFQNFVDVEQYLSRDNKPIMESSIDSIEELEVYLKKHKGLGGEY